MRTIALTLYGSPISGLAISAGESVRFDVSIQDLDTRAAVDLTAASAVLSICSIDIQGNPTEPPEATIAGVVQAPAINGLVRFTLTPVSTTGLAGVLYFDCWITDSTGARTAYLPLSLLRILPAVTVP